ncbi:MAG TPA: dipeptide epimerase [Allosphingosinicella sp.]|jgi:L-alanine-DL-glutamate epimerase-like enolase superfamily enzyme
MSWRLSLDRFEWPLREPFVIARGAQTAQPTLMVSIEDESGHRGRGEACGVDYHGETVATMRSEIETCRRSIERGLSREELQNLLPAGGARNAVDCALWDLEAKRRGFSLFEGLSFPQPTAFTIGMRSLEAYEAAARAHSEFPLLKVKVGAGDPLPAVAAVRRGAPNPGLIVDPNQAWTAADLKRFAPPLADRGVVLIEQPVPVGAETELAGWSSPIALCADELVSTRKDLARARGLFACVNIKLDKTGGLTEALLLAQEAHGLGMQVMAGCMAGSSLCMAPSLVLAPLCSFLDLDGPLLQIGDVTPALSYRGGWIDRPSAALWG